MDEATHAIALGGRHERPQPGAGPERVAGRESRRRRGSDLLDLGKAFARHDHARERRAGLPRVEETLAHTVGHGLGKVGIVEDDVGALATEFERHLLHGLRRHFGNALTGAGGTGEAHHVDIGVGCNGLTHHRANTGDEVEHTSGQAGLMHHFSEDERVDGCHFTGLQHHGVPSGQSRGHLQRDLVQRVVPRGDATHHADGLAHHQRVTHLCLEFVAAQQAGRDLEVGLGQAGLNGLGKLQRHAHFAGDGVGDLVGARLEPGMDLHEVARTVGSAQRAPGREAGLRGSHGGVDIGGRTVGDAGDHLFGGRVGDLERSLAGGRNPGSVDVDAVVCAHGPTLGGHGVTGRNRAEAEVGPHHARRATAVERVEVQPWCTLSEQFVAQFGGDVDADAGGFHRVVIGLRYTFGEPVGHLSTRHVRHARHLREVRHRHDAGHDGLVDTESLQIIDEREVMIDFEEELGDRVLGACELGGEVTLTKCGPRCSSSATVRPRLNHPASFFGGKNSNENVVPSASKSAIRAMRAPYACTGRGAMHLDPFDTSVSGGSAARR